MFSCHTLCFLIIHHNYLHQVERTPTLNLTENTGLCSKFLMDVSRAVLLHMQGYQ